MSLGRLPEILLAALIMGGLLLCWVWTRTSEAKARAVLWEEIDGVRRETLRVDLPADPFRSAGAAPSTGRGVEDRLRRLYPNYAWRLALWRLRVHRLKHMVGIGGPVHGIPPLGFLLLPGLAEAWRRRAVKLAGPVVFPNEILFQMGLWGIILGTTGLLIGYTLCPVPCPPAAALLSLAALLSATLIAVAANAPGRWRRDE